MCAGGGEGRRHSGQYSEEWWQQVEGGDPFPLLSPGEIDLNAVFQN